MPTRTIETEHDLKALVTILSTHKMPWTVSWSAGKKRSTEQNRLQRALLTEAAEQLDQFEDVEHARGYAKLHFGVPIMREVNEAFKIAYDRVLKPLDYEEKIIMMQTPLDFPVTRLMTVKQKTRYLDDMQRHFAEQGVRFQDQTSGQERTDE